MPNIFFKTVFLYSMFKDLFLDILEKIEYEISH